MKHFTRIAMGLVLGTALFTGVSYSADEKTKTNKPVAKTDDELSFDLDAAWKRRIPELSVVDNLPLSEVANYIGKQFPEVNFIVPENARDASMPGITLRNVTLSEILKAIELASVGRIRVSPPQSSAPKVGPDGLPIPGAMAGQNIVAFMVARPSREAPATAPACRVFSLAPYLEGRSDKEAELAIQQLQGSLDLTWGMMKKSGVATQRPELSIHSGTKLLIAVGRDQELAVIDQVVKQLQVGESGVKVFWPGPTKDQKREPGAKPRADRE